LPARALLATLRPTEREAVVMSLVARLDAADVAAVCNIDVPTARMRIGRGLEQLLRESANAENAKGGSR
jgi:DNA-directed RNA polymerase specialized sigma24 family protein